MAIVALISITPSTPISSTIQSLTQLLQPTPTNFAIGPKIQDPATIQITIEWPTFSSPTTLFTSPVFTSLTSNIETITSSHPTILLATLATSPFTTTALLMEYVKVDFPTSISQNTIQADFARFETIFRRRGNMQSVGEKFLATGWTEEYVDGKGEMVKSYVVLRGWEEMGRFEEALGTEEFKEASPILMGWRMPFELWHVEKKEGREGM